MPRTPINYANTYIYQICSLDPNITEIYVGHTTDMTRRKTKHKCCCNNENSKGYHLNVYQFIRANGGWDNWTMIMVEKISCSNSFEARAKEQYQFLNLKASLNSNIPNRTEKEWREENKDIISEKNKEYKNNNKDSIKENYNINKDKIKKQKQSYRENNKEKIKEYEKTYRENNKDKISAYNKMYRDKMKEQI